MNDYIAWKYAQIGNGKSPLERIVDDLPNFGIKIMTMNPNVSLECILKCPALLRSVSWSPHVTVEYIQAHPEIGWNWFALSTNKNLNVPFIKTKIDVNWDWYLLSMNPCIAWQDIKDNPDLPWDWTGVSQNPNITWENVCESKHKPWDYGYLSKHEAITWDIIQSHPELDWDLYYYVSKNPNIGVEIIEQHLDKPWDWNSLSERLPLDFLLKHRHSGCSLKRNPFVDINFIKAHPEEFSSADDWYELTFHPNITEDDIKNNPELPWEDRNIYLNPNISYEFLKEKKILFDTLVILCNNKFLYHPQVYKRNLSNDITCRCEYTRSILNGNPKLYRDLMGLVLQYVDYK